MTLIGPGDQGKYSTLFLMEKYDLKTIYVISRTVEGFVNFSKFIEKSSTKNVTISKSDDINASVRESDIVLASSSSKSALLVERAFLNSIKKSQFICGLSGFYDVSEGILQHIDRVVFDSPKAKRRIEEACQVDFNNLPVKNFESMTSDIKIENREGKTLYLPVGISAMDIAMANYFYKKISRG